MRRKPADYDGEETDDGSRWVAREKVMVELEKSSQSVVFDARVEVETLPAKEEIRRSA